MAAILKTVKMPYLGNIPLISMKFGMVTHINLLSAVNH